MATSNKHKGRKRQPVLSNSGRKVQATARTGGMLTQGNKRSNSAPMGNLTYSYAVANYGEKTAWDRTLQPIKWALLNILEESAEKELAGISHAQTDAARWGDRCNGCYTTKSRTGQCACNAW